MDGYKCVVYAVCIYHNNLLPVFIFYFFLISLLDPINIYLCLQWFKEKKKVLFRDCHRLTLCCKYCVNTIFFSAFILLFPWILKKLYGNIACVHVLVEFYNVFMIAAHILHKHHHSNNNISTFVFIFFWIESKRNYAYFFCK